MKRLILALCFLLICFTVADAATAIRWRYDDNGDGMISGTDTWRDVLMKFTWHYDEGQPEEVVRIVIKRSDVSGGPYAKIVGEWNRAEPPTPAVILSGFGVPGDEGTIIEKYFVGVSCNAQGACSDDTNYQNVSDELAIQFEIPAQIIPSPQQILVEPYFPEETQ